MSRIMNIPQISYRVCYWVFLVIIAIHGLYFLGEIFMYVLIDYPFNKYEPEVVMEAWQLRIGEPIYHPLETGPYAGLYAPLFQVLGALAFFILPETITVLRFFSIASLFLIAFSSWKLAPQQTWMQLVFAVFLILIWHNRVGHFDFHAKPDAFSVMLGFAAIWYAAKEKPNLFVSGVFVALAVLAKQPMLLFLPGIGLALLLHKKIKMVLQFGTAFVISSVVLWWLMALITGGDIFYYTLVQPGGFEIPLARILNAAISILNSMWLPLALVLVLRRIFKNRWQSADTILAITLVFAYPASVLTAAKGGGLSNAYMPFFYLISALIIRNFQIDSLFRLTHSFQRPMQGFLKAAMLLFLAYSVFISLRLHPASTISSYLYRIQAHQNYEALTEKIRHLDGVVYSPMDNYLTLKAGKPLYWSAKSEMDLGAVLPGIQRRVHQIALAADYVVTVNFDSWFRSTRLERDLEHAGFIKIGRWDTEQGVHYILWKKNHE